jgi:type IV pilus assembly protein PilY1
MLMIGNMILKKTFGIPYVLFIFTNLCFLLLFVLPPAADAASMDDYCAIPPFIISGGVNPNLLLTIDNSASMYDPTYIDEGKQDASGNFTREPYYCYDNSYKNKACSTTRTTSCSVDTDCPVNERCEDNIYTGYFENGRCSTTTTTFCRSDANCPESETCNLNVNYSYDIYGDKRFEIYNDPFPSSCDFLISGTLCVNISDADDVTRFVAKGNYLNWLTSSKFDVQKEILTGGKYDTATKELNAETRGCVGRSFIKEPNKADFINFNKGEIDPNEPLGLTFGISGPVNPDTPTEPSSGGQTFLEIYRGDFQAEKCQEAIDCFEPDGNCTNPETQLKVIDCIEGEVGNAYCEHNPSKQCMIKQDCPQWKSATARCSISGTSCQFESECPIGELCVSPGGPFDVCVYGTSPSIQPKLVFQLSIIECWQHLTTGVGAWGDAAVDSMMRRCPIIYSSYDPGRCSITTTDICTQDSDCTTVPGEKCIIGPSAILPGNPAYLCNSNYGGYCYTGGSPDWGSTPDNWDSREFTTSRECLTEMAKKFCGELEFPPVVDPTEDADMSTDFNAGLPSIVADIGVEAQIGEPIEILTVNVERPTEPTGLLQEYSDSIRFGGMSFNYIGSATECIDPFVGGGFSNPLDCPNVCENRHCSVSGAICTSDSDCFAPGETCETIACNILPGGTTEDCPGAENCVIATPGVNNFDGAKIIHYVGEGFCSVNTDTSCIQNFDCPDFDTGEYCNSAGNHDTGLAKQIDDLRATSWTPFSEAFYNAIGYFARMDAHTSPPTFGTSRALGCPGGSDCIRLNNDDFVIDKSPSLYKCQSNNILLISDGLSTADLNNSVQDLVTVYNDGDGQTGYDASNSCPRFSGSRDLDDLAWLAKHREITDFSKPYIETTDTVYKSINTFTVYNGSASGNPGECDPENLLKETAYNGNGMYERAENPEELERDIKLMFSAISAKAASGTAASVLASGADEGAVILQAIFYPRRKLYNNVELNWTGTLQNLWYYIDPLFGASTIREDTPTNRTDPRNTVDSTLHLKNDYIVRFYFDIDSQQTKARLFKDINGDYSSLELKHDIPFEGINNLWEAGRLLWERDISPGANPRNIKTSLNGSTMIDFSTLNASVLRPYMQAADTAEAEAIIRYTHGEDTKCSVTTSRACETDDDCPAGEACGGFYPIIDTNGDSVADFTYPYRSRTAAIDLNNNGILDPGEGSKVWKLGDIVNATPSIMTWVPLNTYNLMYLDDTYKQFITGSDYQNRGIVFTGSNSGMLHAFRLGRLELDWSTQNDQFEFARLINPTTNAPCNPATDLEPCGEEIWSFIPRNVLPYLKYYGDEGYCHIYSVDGTPVLFDASIGDIAGAPRPADGSSWRTILIGSMNYGGACRAAGVACTDCVNAPGVDLGLASPGADTKAEQMLGSSSYFAIDITDPNPDNWQILWEFTDQHIPYTELSTGGLGFSKTGPAIIRMSTRDAENNPDPDTNGEWYVALLSGTTGPIDKPTRQFLGRSDQRLKVFIIDLRTGNLKATIKTFKSNGSDVVLAKAFGGSAIDATVDVSEFPPEDYQDEAMYFTYTNSTIGIGDTFTRGGVVRVLTNGDPNPSNWKGSIVMKDIGATTASVRRLRDIVRKKMWLYFGSGRYFYKKGPIIDDAVSQRNLFGIKEPCFSSGAAAGQSAFDFNCSKTIDFSTAAGSGDLVDVTSTPNAAEGDIGWFLDLDGQNVPDTGYDAERTITNPVETTQGYVLFTTFKPSSDVCGFGGRSHIWALDHNTGGTPFGLQGKALLQVSTGSIEEISLEKAFTENVPGESGYDPDLPINADSKGNRRTAHFIGKPPEGPGLILLSGPPPYANIIHTRER